MRIIITVDETDTIDRLEYKTLELGRARSDNFAWMNASSPEPSKPVEAVQRRPYKRRKR